MERTQIKAGLVAAARRLGTASEALSSGVSRTSTALLLANFVSSFLSNFCLCCNLLIYPCLLSLLEVIPVNLFKAGLRPYISFGLASGKEAN